jgi:predicted nucleotidyltransferase
LLRIVTKTFGVAEVLRKMLVPFKNRIRLAFIYGSIAKGTANAARDVDLLVVCRPPAVGAFAPAPAPARAAWPEHFGDHLLERRIRLDARAAAPLHQRRS